MILLIASIQLSTCNGVYTSQLIRYSRAGGSHQDFLDRGLLLTRKLVNQGFLLVKLKSSLKTFHGRNPDFVNRSGISVLKLKTDMFHLSFPTKIGAYPSQACGCTPGFCMGSVFIIILIVCAVLYVLFFLVLCLVPNVACVFGLSIFDLSPFRFSLTSNWCNFL